LTGGESKDESEEKPEANEGERFLKTICRGLRKATGIRRFGGVEGLGDQSDSYTRAVLFGI